MIRITAWRIFVYAWKHFIRNAWIGVATVVVLVLALLSVNVLVGVQAMLERTVSVLEDRIDISVYFVPKTPDAVLQQTAFFFSTLPQVKSADVHTPEQSLQAFKERHKNDPTILEALQEVDQNPLGASLVIKAKHAEDYPFLLEALKNPQISSMIESQTYDDHAEAIGHVRTIARSVRFFGLALMAVFALFAALIVYNAIRMAMYTQREEIAIMRLVGASHAFIRLPFVLEGIFLAGLSLLVSAGVVALAVAFGEPYVAQFLDGADAGIRQYFVSHGLVLFLVEGGALCAFVAVSSWFAAGRYMKK